jgi:hypothetical protein
VTCKTPKQVTLGSENNIPINTQFLKYIKPSKHFDYQTQLQEHIIGKQGTYIYPTTIQTQQNRICNFLINKEYTKHFIVRITIDSQINLPENHTSSEKFIYGQ